MKLKTLVLRVLTILLSLGAMISMAGGAYFTQTGNEYIELSSESTSFGKWFEMLNGDGSFILGDAEGTWKGSEAFFIISIIVLSLLIIAIVLQFFIKKNWLQLTVKILSIFALIAVLLAFVLLLAGCLQRVANIESVSYMPAVGAWLFLVFGLIGSALGIVCGSKLKNAKKSKRK